MALKHLPPTFCWSRIGPEAGVDLPTLILRKEWERRQGGGRFLWGIGQSLGSSAQVAALRTGSLLALFSPAASRPRATQDKRGKRAGVVVWNAWVDASGQVRQLPQHVFVTSSATLPSGAAREHHYALVCVSPTELSVGISLRVVPERLRSVSTGKPPGRSQGTVVVDCVERAAQAGGKSHPLVFTAELEAPYFVRLTQPTLVKARDLAAIHEASRMGDFDTYTDLTKRVRSEACAQQARGVTRDLFDVPPAEHTASSRLGGARTRHVSRAGDWTQLTMELFHGDSHPFTRGRGRATLF
ncbi:hypothetical protein M3A49_16095 [Paraburkholderia sp. CNPSo 3076]|uniref:hypothetical protein n=1 Tax=Paraburkholderia sp. CNPSo 3076 TaxID=2940936 RepID=UPI0022598BEF|nr:hypothetical protein [Paraburkholderia sp. CNPSo 3076]MCX5541002.1 hypothetical protein [Paraburkholderia sp. CNPSo 3076]